jgi:hypothetical protein
LTNITVARQLGRPPQGRRSASRLAGVADIVAPPVNFSGTVENLGNAFLMIEIEPGRQRCRPAVWLSLYGDMRSCAAALQEEIRDLLTRTFTSP